MCGVSCIGGMDWCSSSKHRGWHIPAIKSSHSVAHPCTCIHLQKQYMAGSRFSIQLCDWLWVQQFQRSLQFQAICQRSLRLTPLSRTLSLGFSCPSRSSTSSHSLRSAKQSPPRYLCLSGDSGSSRWYRLSTASALRYCLSAKYA